MSNPVEQCKWEEIGFDLVPVPFGIGNCSMPNSECRYQGDIDIGDVENCGRTCPAYAEVVLNERYPLAKDNDPDFDYPHSYTKSFGDGSVRYHCRCERDGGDPIHRVGEENEG